MIIYKNKPTKVLIQKKLLATLSLKHIFVVDTKKTHISSEITPPYLRYQHKLIPMINPICSFACKIIKIIILIIKTSLSDCSSSNYFAFLRS